MRTIYILNFRYAPTDEFATEYFTSGADALAVFKRLVEDAEQWRSKVQIGVEFIELDAKESGQIYTLAEDGKTPVAAKE